ncbi:MAG: zinc ribbon domain-containing protein [Kiritimatiellae bacterium]|nr:zinc ribbon domain-containing protein [Kiritimatiellia bacterium]
MATLLICPNCGFENKTGGVFCAKCGGRMGLENAPSFHERKDPVRAIRILMTFVKTAVNLALLLVIVLLLWPMGVPPVGTNFEEAQKFNERLDEISKLARIHGRTDQVLSERDVNNYVVWRVLESGNAGSGQIRLKLESVYLDFKPNAIRVVTLARIGPVKITHMIEGVPMAQFGRPFQLKVQRASIGRLPLPSPLHSWVASKIEQTFSALDRDRDLLNRTREMRVLEDRAALVIGR